MSGYKLQVFLLLLLLYRYAIACPNDCICKWKNGKQTVECVDKGLLVIPDGMDSGTQVLDFSGNNLQSLHAAKFLKMDLINLQRIYLARCRLKSIDRRTFEGLTNLVELDLSANELDSVPSDAFKDCPSLMRLTLNNNPIRVVQKDSFGHLSDLNTLELAACQIEDIDINAFRGLNSLEWLRISRNKLKNIKSIHTWPQSLRGIDFQNNPWDCDCNLQDMRNWLQDFTVAKTSEPVCNNPRKFSGRPVKSIPLKELACLPDVSPTTLFLEMGEGKNVSLICNVHAKPEAHVSWWFQGQLLQNDTMISPDTRLLYFIEEGAEDKRSELFIYNTNSQDNGTFICSAENAAGVVLSNFTIRIILKSEPNYESVELPYEFLLIIISATSVSLVIICFALILSIAKCHGTGNKEITEKRQNLILSNSTKDESIDDFSDISKEGSNATLVERQQMLLYSTRASEEILRSFSPIAMNSELSQSLSCYQIEQNPDLINDAERRQDGDGEDKHKDNFELLPQFDNNCTIYPSVHLNPVRLLNTNNSFRTLPYNRGSKRQTQRYTKDAEFLNYDQFTQEIRYTVDGYPVQETPFSDTESCCSAPTSFQWPPCVPVSILKKPPSETDLPPLHKKISQEVDHIPIMKKLSEECMKKSEELKKSVVAQTQTDLHCAPKAPIRSLCSVVKVDETLTESPDEGYEGDSSVDTSAK